jgi:hypothetical protein
VIEYVLSETGDFLKYASICLHSLFALAPGDGYAPQAALRKMPDPALDPGLRERSSKSRTE